MTCLRFPACAPTAGEDAAPGSTGLVSSGPEGPIRLLVADDDARVRAAIGQTIALEADLVMVADAANAAAALALAESTDPSVALVDLLIPDEAAGLAPIRSLGQRPGCAVVVMSVRGGLRHAALAAGAVAFVEKAGDIDAVLDTIRAAAPPPHLHGRRHAPDPHRRPGHPRPLAPRRSDNGRPQPRLHARLMTRLLRLGPLRRVCQGQDKNSPALVDQHKPPACVLWSRMKGQPLKLKRLLVLPVILTVLGITDLTGSSAPHLTPKDIAFLVVGTVISAVLGATRGATIELYPSKANSGNAIARSPSDCGSRSSRPSSSCWRLPAPPAHQLAAVPAPSCSPSASACWPKRRS
jgi:CheY-like chemotaxis protein